MTDNSRLYYLLEKLVSYPTVSNCSNIELIDFVCNYCESFGSRLVYLPDSSGSKASVMLRFGPDAPGGIILSGHTDVVPALEEDWQSDPFSLVQKNDRLYGRGTVDMKGFIASVISAAAQAPRPEKPVYLALTYDEEVGCLAAPSLIEASLPLISDPHAVIVGEPSSMKPITAHKSITEYRTEFKGISGHSSKPHLGLNAIELAHEYISSLLKIAEFFRNQPSPLPKAPENCKPAYTTVQVGTIRGGSATNVIPDRCMISYDLRSFYSADKAYFENEIEQAMRSIINKYSLPENAIQTGKSCDVPPLEPEQSNPAISLASRLCGRQSTEWAPYATEAGQYQAAGLPALILGPGSIEQAHQIDEWIEISQLNSSEEMIRNIFQLQSEHQKTMY